MAHLDSARPTSSDLAALLHDGPLLLVPVAAELVLGHTIDPRTACRWGNAGRGGIRLPTLRGRRRSRLTTAACLRAWLAATSDWPQATTVRPAARTATPSRDAAADAVLSSFGLGRKQREVRK